MNINLSNCNYSYANAIGNTLRQPLFKLVSNIAIAASGKPLERLALTVSKVALNCLVAALFIAPTSIIWFMGKLISHCGKTKIDHRGLSKAPPEIQPPQDMESDQRIDIRDLSNRYDKLNSRAKKPYNKNSKNYSLRQLCNWTATKNLNIYPDDATKRELFCKQLSLFLKGIIKKIESGEVTKEKEGDILMELAEASTRCYPTWLEVAEKLFEEVNNKTKPVEVKLLKIIQEYKKSIILEFCQQEANTQWHALNYVRNILGFELGLNTTLNKFDPYALDDDPAFGKGLSKWLFLERYENVNRLIASVGEKINSQKYDQSYHDFLNNMVKQKNIKNSEDYVGSHFFDENYKINEAGVNFLLKSIGVLK